MNSQHFTAADKASSDTYPLLRQLVASVCLAEDIAGLNNNSAQLQPCINFFKTEFNRYMFEKVKH